MVTRGEGYRRSAGKEAIALEVAGLFFGNALDTRVDVITDKDDNYALGDFKTSSGATIECKSQPIDPVKYPLNFVEVFEVTHNDMHLGGLAALAELLDMSVDQLATVPVWMSKQRRSMPLGRPERISVSIRSIAGSAATCYVNPLMGGRHVYVYGRDELMAAITKAVAQGLVRGAGKSNDDTFAVKIPLADRRWSRGDDFDWQWHGIGVETDAIESLQELLTPSA
jgi:hypothetical protein